MKKILAIFLLCLLKNPSEAQTIFSYGNKKVSKQEFINSFHKNNIDTNDKKIAVENYLNLFIRFKLKVQAAYDMKLDTLQRLKSELKEYREQILPNYLMDLDTLHKLIIEAHKRMQEDLEVQHIFISYRKDANIASDIPISEKEKMTANEKASEVSAKLLLGEDFEALATKYSDDAEVNNNRGYLGFVTAFTLPYSFENTLYSLNDKQASTAIKSDAGIHFFKRIGSRNALGKIRAAQILISIPANATNDEIRNRKLLADEIHDLIAKGANFDSLAFVYSDDASSANNGGVMQEIEVGKFNQIFEINVFGLKKDNEVSEVFRTDYGFHIVKRISVIPPEKELKLAETYIKNKIQSDSRTEIAESAFKEKAYKEAISKGINTKEKNFIEKHLAELNPLFAEQLKNFKEGNLLFEIMDKKIWSKSSNDLTGLKQFYQANKNNYNWKQSVQAIIITVPDNTTAEKIRTAYLVNKSIENIKKNYSEVVLIDTGRYEASDLIGIGSQNAQSGYVSSITTNESDKSSTFVIIEKKYNDPSMKSFEQAKGMVVNDYQLSLENKWIESLKLKYPVVVNQKALTSILAEIN